MKPTKNKTMYITKTITRADGTTYESAFWTATPVPTTEEQEQMQRAINQFGTSS